MIQKVVVKELTATHFLNYSNIKELLIPLPLENTCF